VTHLTFAALFIPFILLKIVIVEKYPELRNRLFAVGTVLFATVFVIVLTSGVVYTGRVGQATTQRAATEVRTDLAGGKDLFVTKCSKCHRLERPLGADKTPQAWRQTVDTMRRKDPAWISRGEAEIVIEFLVSLGVQASND
jgi:hypothetical protein